jgi:hypothetical protein
MPDRINFARPINDSVQIGDILYYMRIDFLTGQAGEEPQEIGPITDVGAKFVEVDSGTVPTYPLILGTEQEIETGTITVGGVTVSAVPPVFLFRKNNQANISTLLGYYANINITTINTNKTELYSVGSEIFVSSK